MGARGAGVATGGTERSEYRTAVDSGKPGSWQVGEVGRCRTAIALRNRHYALVEYQDWRPAPPLEGRRLVVRRTGQVAATVAGIMYAAANPEPVQAAILSGLPLFIWLLSLLGGPYYFADARRATRDGDTMALRGWVVKRLAPYCLPFGIPCGILGLILWRAGA